jgi:hypothetical protein
MMLPAPDPFTDPFTGDAVVVATSAVGVGVGAGEGTLQSSPG